MSRLYSIGYLKITMEGKKRRRNTYNKIRLALFLQSYVCYSIRTYLRSKYRIEKRLTKPEIYAQYSYKRAIPEISRLSKALNLNHQTLWKLIVLNQKPILGQKIYTDKRTKIFLRVESEMIFLSIAKRDKENIINEDYERAILSPAIERVAGNDLRRINSDFIFSQRHKELSKEYTRLYYKIAHYYKLPTTGIRAFILRLITK